MPFEVIEIIVNKIPIRDRIEGEWPRDVSPNNRDFEKCVTEQISINSLNLVVFWLFCHFMHNDAIKPSTVTKLGDYSLKCWNFSKTFGACGFKNVSLNPIFPKNFPKKYSSAPLAPKNVSLNSQSHPSLLFDPWYLSMS